MTENPETPETPEAPDLNPAQQTIRALVAQMVDDRVLDRGDNLFTAIDHVLDGGVDPGDREMFLKFLVVSALQPLVALAQAAANVSGTTIDEMIFPSHLYNKSGGEER